MAESIPKTSVEFTIGNEQFRLQSRVNVPAGPATVSDLLPLARALSDVVVRETSRKVEESGNRISCCKGCGACCKNLVAISEVEARRIRTVVEELPEPRRSEVKARFAAALEQFDRAGLLATLREPERWMESSYDDLVGTYFQQGIDCPFLEEGACSIYEERPLTCREYLVTSPAEYCAKVGSKGVVQVRLPLRMFNAVARWQAPATGHFRERSVPLILALEWAEAHPDDPPPKPGPELFRDLLNQFGG